MLLSQLGPGIADRCTLIPVAQVPGDLVSLIAHDDEVFGHPSVLIHEVAKSALLPVETEPVLLIRRLKVLSKSLGLVR